MTTLRNLFENSQAYDCEIKTRVIKTAYVPGQISEILGVISGSLGYWDACRVIDGSGMESRVFAEYLDALNYVLDYPVEDEN